MKIKFIAYKSEIKNFNNIKDVISEIENNDEYDMFKIKCSNDEYKSFKNTYLLKENYKIIYENYVNKEENYVNVSYVKNDKIITIYYYENKKE